MNVKPGFGLWVAAVWLGLFMSGAEAASVTFSSADKPDLVPGVDLRENSYVFSGALDVGGGLTLTFDSSKFADLILSAYPPDLDPLVTQPDAALTADGLVTLTAQTAHPSGYVAGFVVEFRRLEPLPPTQTFELFDADFNIVAAGQALSVPEPATAVFIASGALFVLRRSHLTPKRPA
jgi:hypothetical protein